MMRDSKRIDNLSDSQTMLGGICKITNSFNGKFLLFPSAEIRVEESKFLFGQLTYVCFFKELEEDWTYLGPESFTFEVVEQMEREDDISDSAFEEALEQLFFCAMRGFRKKIDTRQHNKSR